MTTLDMLNRDCWNAVLNFVPVKDIVRSERVSRQWRDIAMQYLQGTNLCLYLYSCKEHCYYNKCIPKCRIIELPWPNQENRLHLIRKVTEKFGPSIIASQCTNGAVFKIIKRNCPNLQQLIFVEVSDNNYNVFSKEKCMKLKWISFRSCNWLTDVRVSSFLKNEIISELDFYSNDILNGRCLKNINLSRLTSLCLNNCVTLDMRRVLLAADSMTELTKLELSENDVGILRSVPTLLDRLPNLECLALCDYEEIIYMAELAVDILFESISRLSRLKRLALSNNPNLRDKYLETVARGCPLQYLDISCCDEVTVRGLQALSLAGGTLRTLSIAHIRVFSSEDVATCVAGLPNLQILDVGGTRVTSRLAEAIEAQARPCPLRIFAAYTHIPTTEQYAGITLESQEWFSSHAPNA